MPKKPSTAGPTIYINFFDEIDFLRVNFFMERTTALLKQDPEALYFLFSSTGGDVNAGFVLYSYLRALPVKIVMHATASIDSIANVVFLTGDERYAAPEATFLFHGVTTEIKGRVDLAELNERKGSIEEDEKKIGRIFETRTTLAQEDIKRYFRQGETKDAEFAKRNGIVSDIRESVIPKGANVVDFNFNVLK